MIRFNPWIVILVIGIPAIYALIMLIVQIVPYLTRKPGRNELIDEEPEELGS